jgi:L-threonylcarbamoyladenylate synthase
MVELFADSAAIRAQAGDTTAAVLIGEPAGIAGTVVRMPADAVRYAARLYDVLHDLDRRELSRILIELPPATDEWLAVRDRLTRAAS